MRHHRRLVAPVFVSLGAALLLLGGCGIFDNDNVPTRSANGRGKGALDAPQGGGRTAGARPDSYERAMRLKEDGDCAGAIALLKPMAERGRGYEVAQLQLGECYLQLAGKPDAPQTARADGAAWILKAANSRLPSAQLRAARLYVDGVGVETDPIEAAKWLLLLRRNPLRYQFGISAGDPALERRLNGQLSESDMHEAEARAAAWQPVEQPTVQPASQPAGQPAAAR